MTTRQTLRIAAVADMHVKKGTQGNLHALVEAATEAADVLLLCGDLTDYGTVEEARILAKDISSALRIPAIGVLGNHDGVRPGERPRSDPHRRRRDDARRGRTKTSIPVYNVAMPLLLSASPEQPAFRVVEVPVGEPALTS